MTARRCANSDEPSMTTRAMRTPAYDQRLAPVAVVSPQLGFSELRH